MWSDARENIRKSSSQGRRGNVVSQATFSMGTDVSEPIKYRDMSKEGLIKEFLMMERKLKELEERVELVRRVEEKMAGVEEDDYEFHRGEFPMHPKLAEKIHLLQKQILQLKLENQSLLDSE